MVAVFDGHGSADRLTNEPHDDLHHYPPRKFWSCGTIFRRSKIRATRLFIFVSLRKACSRAASRSLVFSTFPTVDSKRSSDSAFGSRDRIRKWQSGRRAACRQSRPLPASRRSPHVRGPCSRPRNNSGRNKWDICTGPLLHRRPDTGPSPALDGKFVFLWAWMLSVPTTVQGESSLIKGPNSRSSSRYLARLVSIRIASGLR